MTRLVLVRRIPAGGDLDGPTYAALTERAGFAA